MNFDCFRAYDIRGVYPTDLDEEAYYRIAKAYTLLFHPKTMRALRGKDQARDTWREINLLVSAMSTKVSCV